MTPKERIKYTFEFKTPDRVGIYDNLPSKTTKKWNKKVFPEFDLALFDLYRFDKAGYKKALDKSLFLVVSFSCPFQKAAEDMGLENALIMMAQEPQAAQKVFAENTQGLIAAAEKIRQDGFVFDAAWLWSDMAYKKATYFSSDTYKKLLYQYHAQIVRYFKSLGMPLILHCDGNCLSFVPLFLKAGVRALNQLEIDCGFSDLHYLKKEYGRDLVLFGNMPALVLEKDKNQIENVFKERLEIAKSGAGFIYHSDKPIPETVSLENYEFALEMVRKYGAY